MLHVVHDPVYGGVGARGSCVMRGMRVQGSHTLAFDLPSRVPSGLPRGDCSCTELVNPPGIMPFKGIFVASVRSKAGTPCEKAFP